LSIITKGLIGLEDLSTGNGTFTRSTSTGGTNTLTKVMVGSLGRFENLRFADQFANLAAAYADLPAGGGTVLVPPGYTETLSSSLTMNKSGAGFIFLGPATITMGSNQVIVPAATHGVYLKGNIPFGGGSFASGKGVTFVYTGSGKAFQVGDGAGATNRVFEFSDITVDLSGASSGASGLYMTNVVYFKLSTPSFVGNNSTTGTKGIVCDGTGNFCGTGIIINPYMTGLGTGILGTGSGGNAMNAVVIIGGTVGSSVVGAIGVDIENGDSSSVYGLDLESLAVAVKLGANAAGNFIRIRQEANTTDVQALAGSSFNVVQVERANAPVVSDAGTSNQFYRMQDGKFLNVYTPLIQSPSGGNTALVDNASVTQAAIVPGAFEVFNIFALAAGAKIQDASSGVHAGITLKKGTGAGNYTTASTTYVDVDATNLGFTATIPTGWKLAISASGQLGTATAAVAASVSLLDGATVVETSLTGTGVGVLEPWALNWVINGDGNSHTVKLQFKTSNGADSATIANSSATILPTITFTLLPSN
jgi:hypothetical protein